MRVTLEQLVERGKASWENAERFELLGLAAVMREKARLLSGEADTSGDALVGTVGVIQAESAKLASVILMAAHAICERLEAGPKVTLEDLSVDPIV